jgi:hypothetical protein
MTERPDFNCTLHGFDDVASWCEAFYTHAANSGLLFRSPEGFLMFLDATQGPRRLLYANELYAVIPSIVNLIRPVERGRDVPAIMQNPQILTLFSSDARHLLPQIDAVVKEPVVAHTPKGYCLIDKPGYDHATRIYYHAAADSDVIKVRHDTKYLERAFEGVPFQSKEARNNVFAWLVSGVVMDPNIITPLMAVSGNDRGIGKSSLVQACGIILTGHQQSPVQHHGAELEKGISSRFMEGSRFLAIDNVVMPQGQAFNNDRLARLLTDSWSKKLRILGQSRTVSQSGVMFSITMNSCRLGPDLSTRSLSIPLYRTTLGPMVPYCVEEAREHRSKIYGELLGLALSCGEAKRQTYSPMFRFRGWLDFVHPRICPTFGRLALDTAEELDDRLQDLFGYGVDNGSDGHPFTAAEFYKVLRNDPDRYPGLLSHVLSACSERGRLIKLGTFLSQQVGRVYSFSPTLSVELHAKKSSPKHAITYYFTTEGA